MVNRAKRLLDRANQHQTVGAAALVISAAYLLSRLLGLLRDRLLVAEFGKGELLDAYTAAFRLPELLFTLLVSGAFAVAFIPVLTEHLQRDDRAQAWRITSTLLNLLVLATIAGSLIMALFADPLTRILAFGFDAERHRLTVELTRIMLITPALFAISSVLGGVQQSFNRFLVFALAGVFYNLGIIAGILWLAPDFSVYGVAWGVVIGVVIQALVQMLGLYGLGFRYQLIMNLKLAGVRKTLALMAPRSLSQSIDQVHYVAETMIGSMLAVGSITAFTLANNLKNVPLVLISGSIATAVFPRLAARAANGARQELIETYVTTARLILFLSIPAAIFAILARGYIVRLLYGFGDVDTANVLGWFAGTIVFTGLFMLVSRIYYAMQDTRTPLYLSIASIPLNILLSFMLAQSYGVIGLAMSASLIALLQAVLLMAILYRRHGSFGEMEILRGFGSMVLAGAIMAPTLYIVISRFLPLYADDRGFLTLAPKFVVIVFVGLVAYLAPCYFLKLKEVHLFAARIKELMIRSFNLT